MWNGLLLTPATTADRDDPFLRAAALARISASKQAIVVLGRTINETQHSHRVTIPPRARCIPHCT
ncbi:hypothetical protein [Nocardia abscessus]|uniref:hypothetical protein n=1 Tax=Nocardia abscessus TaxID=120957 RepID=UPI00030361CB|nr:hypothetical protein [Nocardia abscessus]MCC3329442.1 hypothetical protein [Nocardia abscessus]